MQFVSAGLWLRLSALCFSRLQFSAITYSCPKFLGHVVAPNFAPEPLRALTVISISIPYSSSSQLKLKVGPYLSYPICYSETKNMNRLSDSAQTDCETPMLTTGTPTPARQASRPAPLSIPIYPNQNYIRPMRSHASHTSEMRPGPEPRTTNHQQRTTDKIPLLSPFIAF